MNFNMVINITNVHEIYKCNICGNTVSVVHDGVGTLVCCDQPMEKMEIKTKENEGPTEKHVPVVSIDGNHLEVNIGDVDHPMEENHYISLIQVLKGDDVIAGKRLKPGDKPHASFVLEDTDNIKIRAYCNVHGLWTN